jgi:hypothetical protein
MSDIVDYISSLSDDVEEVDLSRYDFPIYAKSWTKLRGFKEMKRLTLPPSLLVIKKEALYRSTQLTDVTFPSSLRSIEAWAFAFCSGLAIHDFKLPDSVEDLGDAAFYGCEGLTGKLSTHITGFSSFLFCRGLSELNLANCKVIDDNCFARCTGLIGALKLPFTLQYIGDCAFANCTGLTGFLIIPPFVSFIHPDAFQGCSGMISVEQSIRKHFVNFESWKARGNVLMTLITFDEEYRRVVEENGGTLHSALSNSFLSDYSKDAQLIYKAAAHVDGTDKLANGISRLIISFLPMHRRYYGTLLSNDEVDRLIEEGQD